MKKAIGQLLIFVGILALLAMAFVLYQVGFDRHANDYGLFKYLVIGCYFGFGGVVSFSLGLFFLHR